METTLTASDRGVVTTSYALITPANFVDNRLPHLDSVVARPLATPRFTTALFGQYLLDFEASGRSLRPLGRDFENFLYIVDGEVSVVTAGDEQALVTGCFCFVPAGAGFEIRGTGSGSARVLWTKRHYEQVEGLAAPAQITGHVSEVAPIEPGPPASYTYRELLPSADPSFDMAMNVLTAPPGGSIGMVEMHHQEHGLLMLEGQGVYYLAGDHHEVFEGDYIYMAPYCPQSFRATGPRGGTYLLYKDVNRDGF